MLTTKISSDYWFVFQNERLLLALDNENKLITTAQLATLQPLMTGIHALGTYHHLPCYCAEVPADLPLPAFITTHTQREAYDLLAVAWHPALAKAISVLHWDKNHAYCGRCAAPTVICEHGFERICTVCKLPFYPRISPSIIVLIKRGEQLLMARSPHFTPGVYALIAGFVEPGESLEEAVHREVFEETALKIKNLRYFGSQPWPFPDSLMIGFTADYASGELLLDKTEIEDANWYRYDQLPGRPSSKVSIAAQLIDHFIAEQLQCSLK